MKIGSLTAEFILNHPDRRYSGSDEAVTGNILLEYHAGDRDLDKTELFGPLRVALTFHGRTKTKIWKQRGDRRAVYRGRATLFSTSDVIYDRPLRLQSGARGRLPFEGSVIVPSATKLPRWQGVDIAVVHFPESIQGQPLPPTFSASYYGFTHQYEAFTEYRIEALLEMPSINVKIAGPDPVNVLCGQQLTSASAVVRHRVTTTHHVLLHNEYLLPESERPNSLLQKAKAKFKYDLLPEYHFDVVFSAPDNIYRGEPIDFEISIKPDHQRSTAPLVPEIQLYFLEATLVAQTTVHGEGTFLGDTQAEGSDVVWTFQEIPDSCRSFTKANEYRTTVTTSPVACVPASFSTFNIMVSHVLRVKISLMGAKKRTEIERKMLVTLHPPVEGSAESANDPGEGSSRREETLEYLPRYEAPPEYADGAPGPSNFVNHHGDSLR